MLAGECSRVGWRGREKDRTKNAKMGRGAESSRRGNSYVRFRNIREATRTGSIHKPWPSKKATTHRWQT